MIFVFLVVVSLQRISLKSVVVNRVPHPHVALHLVQVIDLQYALVLHHLADGEMLVVSGWSIDRVVDLVGVVV
jgi:hypothetical protein